MGYNSQLFVKTVVKDFFFNSRELWHLINEREKTAETF